MMKLDHLNLPASNLWRSRSVMRLRTKEELGLPKWVPAVEGTFDDPPIAMWQSGLKLSLVCLCPLAAAGLVILFGVSTGGYISWLSVFGFVAAFFGWQAVKRGALVLMPEGLVWRTAFRTTRYRWSDFDSFRVHQGRTKMVGGEFSASYKRDHRWSMGCCQFGGFWELPPQRIVDVLNEARSRWGPPTKAA